MESLYLYLFVITEPLFEIILYKGHAGIFVRGLGHLVDFREKSKILDRDTLNF